VPATAQTDRKTATGLAPDAIAAERQPAAGVPYASPSHPIADETMTDDTISDVNPAAPTSTAATPTTEPEIIAGIASAEGQPATLSFTAGGPAPLPGLLLVGTAAVFGLVAGIGLCRLTRAGY
jgi:hypothetical protein